LKFQCYEVSSFGSPAIFEDLNRRSSAVADPRVEIPISIPVRQAESAAITVLIDSGDEGDVGKAAGCTTRIQEEGILFATAERAAFSQIDLKLITR